MNKYVLLLILMCSGAAMMAQSYYIKAGGGIGGVPYEGTPGWNVALQCAYQFASRFSAFLSLGTNGDRFTSSGRSLGSSGSDARDNSWRNQYSERLHYMDAGLKYRLIGGGNVYQLKGTAGASLAQSVFHYPETLVINRGIIEQREDVTQKVETPMFLLGIDNHFSIYQAYRCIPEFKIIERHLKRSIFLPAG